MESSLRSATILMAAAYETGLYVAPEHLKQEFERVYLAKQLEIEALPEAKRAESLADRYPQCESTLKSAWEVLVPMFDPAVRMNSQGRK